MDTCERSQKKSLPRKKVTAEKINNYFQTSRKVLVPSLGVMDGAPVSPCEPFFSARRLISNKK